MLNFDISHLSEDQLGHIEYVLNSPSYDAAFKPYLVSLRDSVRHLLEDPSQARKDGYPDDFLRGEIAAVTGLIKFFDNLILQTNSQRVFDAQAHTPEEQYDRLRATGFIRNNGQTTAPRPSSPTEDF